MWATELSEPASSSTDTLEAEQKRLLVGKSIWRLADIISQAVRGEQGGSSRYLNLVGSTSPARARGTLSPDAPELLGV